MFRTNENHWNTLFLKILKYLKMFQRFINQIQNIVRYVILYKNTLLIADVSLLVISVWPWQNNNVLLYPDVKDDYF